MPFQLLRFAGVGGIGFFVDAGVLWLALQQNAGYFFGRAISFIAAVYVTWRLNRRLTFTQSPDKSAWKEWWQYFIAMIFGGCVNYATYGLIMLHYHPNTYLPFIGVAVGSLVGMIMNFTTARFLVFHHPRKSI